MARLRLLVKNISSGYLQVAANALFTVISVPLALHYLSKKEFGLWALVTQVVGYLMLIDMGITAAITRVLIDHKDRPGDGAYGSIVKTGLAVLVVQGLLIAALAWALGFWLPRLANVSSDYVRSFQFLVIGHGLVTGVLFAGRMFAAVLQAHQRFDIVNYAAIVSFATNLVVLWITFHLRLELFSFLIAYTAGLLVTNVILMIAAVRMRLLAPVITPGRVDKTVFKQLFWFGSDLFLLTVGLQLITQSQILIVTKVMGLEAAAIWAIATKAYLLAQQFIWRLWDFSSSTISEMVVRQERERLLQRFRDIFVVTASASVFAGVTVAACNESLLAVWTGKQIAWQGINDVLMAVLFIVTSITRLHVGLIGTTKQIRSMRYIYLGEGFSFVAVSLLLAPLIGLPAVIASGIIMNVLWTGVYGTRRTAEEFQLSSSEILFQWLGPALRFGAAFSSAALICWWLGRPLPPLVRLPVCGIIIGSAGVVLFWVLGLPPNLREEFRGFASRVRRRFRSVADPARS